MTTVRVAAVGDVPAIAALFVRVFRQGGPDGLDAVADYFRRIYFANPWVSDDMPSLVMEHAARVVGFIGVIPIPLRIDGRPLRAAVGGNLMTEPGLADPLSTVKMVRRYLSGAQNLSFTDTANIEGAALWTGLGGRIARYASMRWVVAIRPAGFLVRGALRSRPTAVRSVAAWVAAPVDALRPRSMRRVLTATERARIRPVDAQQLRTLVDLLADRDHATFDGDDAGFAWLVARCSEKEEFGALRIIAIDDDRGRPIAAALYYPNSAGIGQVVGWWARRRSASEAFDLLVADAAAQGSTALQGQADSHLYDVLDSQPVFFLRRHESVAVHSSSPDLVRRVVEGDLTIGRLFGEWWTRLQGDVLR